MNTYRMPPLPDDLVREVVEIDRIQFTPDTEATLKMVWDHWHDQLAKAIAADAKDHPRDPAGPAL